MSPRDPRIRHIVVLMLENRSFDNMLGWLYDPANAPPFDRVPRGQPFDGVSGKSLTNPVPAPLGGGLASVGKTTDMSSPNPNPNEPYPDVYGQLFDVNPPPPIIPDATTQPSMQGFVANYAEAIRAYNSTHAATAIHADPRAIMHGFAPESVPVIAGLANAYAVCDRWFSSVPTETFPNRSFLHTGNSAGYVFNNWKTGKAPWDIGLLVNKSPTIFNLLEDAAVSWRIYHGGSLLTCFGYLLHERLHPFATPDPRANRLFPMDQFWKDAARADGLPAYSFIEPRYFSSVKHGPQNDEHPPYFPLDVDGPSNVLRGEELISDVYRALSSGPNWASTLFVITYDEHGGCYDHVPPPSAVPPDDVVVPPPAAGGSGFRFNRLGVRVPAVLVSPWIAPGTVCSTVFDHTSVAKTVIRCFGVTDRAGAEATLGAREAAAHDLFEVLTLDEPRADRPAITPRPAPPFEPSIERPLTALQKNLLAAAAHHLARLGAGLLDVTRIHTAEHASTALDEHAETLGGLT